MRRTRFDFDGIGTVKTSGLGSMKAERKKINDVGKLGYEAQWKGNRRGAGDQLPGRPPIR